MLERHPDRDGWVVTDAATATAVLLDPATWSSDRFDGPRPAEHDRWVKELRREDPAIDAVLAGTPQALIGVDPPDHPRLRAVLRRAFAPAVVRRLEPVVAAEVARALPALLTGKPVDAVAAFTRPVPFRVVARVLGAPERTWDRLEALAHAASTDDTASEDRAQLRARLLAEADVLRFFAEQLAGPGLPGEDQRVLPAVRAAIAAGEVTPREGAGLCREVLVAGADSVGHHLAGALDVLARDPARADALRRDRDGDGDEALAAFIEERLARDPPFTGFWRRATRPVELAGTPVPEDGLVLLRFADASSGASRHLSFGHGIHFCLGAALARLEAHAALRAILTATSAIAPAGPPERLASPDVGGWRRLPLRLIPAAPA